MSSSLRRERLYILYAIQSHLKEWFSMHHNDYNIKWISGCNFDEYDMITITMCSATITIDELFAPGVLPDICHQHSDIFKIKISRELSNCKKLELSKRKRQCSIM